MSAADVIVGAAVVGVVVDVDNVEGGGAGSKKIELSDPLLQTSWGLKSCSLLGNDNSNYEICRDHKSLSQNDLLELTK
jgi:hypothetical protein